MSEDQNSQSVPAADPAEDHETPGGQPGDHDNPKGHVQGDGGLEGVDTVLETPGGTTVHESPSE